MSGSGITPINSGPLVIRTYLDNSANNTYILGKYDYPVSSNYVLITSANGRLAPSDDIYVSSVRVSSMTTSTLTGSTIMVSNIYASSVIASTVVVSSIEFSSIVGSSIQLNRGNISTVNVSSIFINNGTYSSITGNYANINNLTVLNQITTAPSTISNLGNVTFTYLNGTSTISTNELRTNIVSTPYVSTTFLSTSMIYNSTFTISNVSTIDLKYMKGQGSTITANFVTVNSTCIASTVVLSDFTLFDKLGISMTTYLGLTDNINASVFYSKNMITSTAVSNNIYYSTMYTNKNISQQFNTSNTYGSSINGSTIVTSTGYTNIGMYSSILSSTIIVSSIITSSIIGNNIYVSTLFGSTLTTSQFSGITGNYSTLLGSTLTASNVNTSTMFFSTLLGSTLFISSCATSTLNMSTMTVSTLVGAQLYLSSLVASTIFGSVSYLSSIVVPYLSTSSIYGSTTTVSSIILSSMNGITIGIGSSLSQNNTIFGSSALFNNTSGNNTVAFGYNVLYNNTTGNYNTASGSQVLYNNTTGSYNTAIGYNAGSTLITGNYNTYIGSGAVPSNTNVTNEIVVGGANSLTQNVGNGSNTIKVGNNGIVRTILNGNVSIGTTPPTDSRLNLNGSYQQIGGTMAITNNQPSNYSQIWLYNDSVLGYGWFLNGLLNGLDGGAKTGTLRNDYGTLRLQAKNGSTNSSYGITILSNGNVGIGSASPSYRLDVAGSAQFRGNITLNGNYGVYMNGTYSSGANNTAFYTTNIGTNNLIFQSPYGIGFQTYNGAVNIAFNTTNGTSQFQGTVTTSTISGTLVGNCSGSAANGVTGGSIVATSGTFNGNVSINGTVSGSGNIYGNLLQNPKVAWRYVGGINNQYSLLVVMNGTRYYWPNYVVVTGYWTNMAAPTTSTSYYDTVSYRGDVFNTTYNDLIISYPYVNGTYSLVFSFYCPVQCYISIWIDGNGKIYNILQAGSAGSTSWVGYLTTLNSVEFKIYPLANFTYNTDPNYKLCYITATRF